MAPYKRTSPRPIESYDHRDKERLNNPDVGLVTPETDPDVGQQKKRYEYDPHLDPQLVWTGKAEHMSFEVPTVSLHVHERIEPRTIIEAVRKKNSKTETVQLGLFEAERDEPLREVIKFYQHKHGWSNRIIAGDSLLVMNSLLEKEGMAGKVQMIYIDPPYGIKYGSNFQPFVNKRDVEDGKDEDLTSEPEQIKAFRDTWELGIHSYLTYLRDRLLLARELLTESGSIFVQINDKNLHLVRILLDEVFGRENAIAIITFNKTGGQKGTYIGGICDYLLWYSKDKGATKFRRLFTAKDVGGESGYSYIELSDGTRRSMTKDEKANPTTLPPDARPLLMGTASSAGWTESCTFPLEFQGRTYLPEDGHHWKTHREGLQRLITAGRLYAMKETVSYVRYFDDFPVVELTNVWTDTRGALGKVYAVQTSEKVIERCILMTTDPGDLVFDPTCGSGTTAYCAEKWGRRWITCDTSRVALAIARQRLMTAVFDSYKLAHPEEGVGSGFQYKTVPHVTLESIANNPEIDGLYARMHPTIDKTLADLNAALKGSRVKFKVTTGGRKEKFVDFSAPDDATFTMDSGQVVKVNELLEWEVPFAFPKDWPESAREPFTAFHTARRAMQKAMDEAIARRAEQETLYDQPLVEEERVRVTGPFTVEAVPAPVAKSPDEILEAEFQPADPSIARSGETLRQREWREELLRTGIRGKGGQYIHFARLEPLPCDWLHADGETRPSDLLADHPLRVVVSFGPDHAPLEQRQVSRAIEEALKLVPTPKIVVFAAFQFDPEAAKDIEETSWPGVTLLKAQMNADLLTEDLKKKRASNESFWLIGQPDVELRQEENGTYVVEVHGFDYYDIKTGELKSGGANNIAVWLLDTDYDGRSLYPRQVFFPMAGANEGWKKLARDLKGEIDPDRISAYCGTISLPFEPGDYKRIAVKIVDDRGIETLKVMNIEQ